MEWGKLGSEWRCTGLTVDPLRKGEERATLARNRKGRSRLTSLATSPEVRRHQPTLKSLQRQTAPRPAPPLADASLGWHFLFWRAVHHGRFVA